jgi:hypothetical protein
MLFGRLCRVAGLGRYEGLDFLFCHRPSEGRGGEEAEGFIPQIVLFPARPVAADIGGSRMP